jgi:hypothetical protein
MKWALSFLALAVLYVLTFPVAVWGIYTFRRPAAGKPPPGWFRVYAMPYGWLRTTPAQQPLDDYFKWVARQLP